jgi:NhaA family Na+:H+ antiporter
MSWQALYGVALLCGIGFTMSLFIGSLAFEHGGLPANIDERAGVLMGSFFSAICGYLVLRHALRKAPR